MTLDEIDDAVRHRNYRRKAQRMREAFESGSFNPMAIRDGETHYLGTLVPTTSVRDAAVAALDAFIAEQERELASLGVDVSSPTQMEGE